MNNPSANCGWFAQEHGKLTLPSMHVTSNTASNWGESPGDTSIDLVNSLRVTPKADVPEGGGDLQVSFLATDRNEPSAALGPMWDTNSGGCQVLGVWEFRSPTGSLPIPFTKADLTIRYDDTRFSTSAPALVLGVATAGTNWGWKVLDWQAGTIDTQDHTYSKTAVSFPSAGAMYVALAPGKPGDINLDGNVDVVDTLYMVDAFGSVKGDANYDPAADFNCDDSVDVVDLLYQVDNFGCGTCDSTCVGGMSSSAESQRVDGAVSSGQKPTWYEALEQVGLLDVYMQYIAEHPEAARTW